jgi:hypothetical protein
VLDFDLRQVGIDLGKLVAFFYPGQHLILGRAIHFTLPILEISFKIILGQGALLIRMSLKPNIIRPAEKKGFLCLAGVKAG